MFLNVVPSSIILSTVVQDFHLLMIHSERKSRWSGTARRSGLIAAVLLALALLAPGLAAEVIQLKSGEVLEGRIVTQDDKRIVLKTADGNQRIVWKRTVRRVVYDPGLGKKLVIDQKRAEAAKIAARKQAEADRLRKEAEAAEQARQATEAAKEAAAREERRQAEADRARYAVLVAEYRQRALAEADRLAREKEQQEQKEVAKKEESEETQKPETIEPEPQNVVVDRWGPLWRSALIPGWGQFYAGNNVSGGFFGGLFAFAAINSYNLRRIALDSRAEYVSFTDTTFLLPFVPGLGTPAAAVVYFETDRRSETYARNVKRQQQSVMFLGGVYLVQLIHAAFLSKEIPTALIYDPADPDSTGGMAIFAEEDRTDLRDQRLKGPGTMGGDARLGVSYSLRF